MIRLSGIGHVLLRVSDLERSRRFYTGVLGFEVTEQDPEHGGLFMAIAGQAHTIDLFPAREPAPARPPGSAGLGHIAFRVESPAALRDAYFGLQDQGVEIVRTIDHVSQQSDLFGVGGPDMAPYTPKRSERPGEAVPLLDIAPVSCRKERAS